MLKPVLMLVVVTALASLASLAPAAPYDTSACARGYSPCLPVKSDIDCGQIPNAKKPVRVTGEDPHGLDADRDGLGCEVSGEGGGKQSPWGLILRKPPRKEATSVKVGDTLTVVGWSPSAFKGERRWALCNAGIRADTCLFPVSHLGSTPRPLKGTVQTLGIWKVRRNQVIRGVLKLTLVVNNKDRASDSVPVR